MWGSFLLAGRGYGVLNAGETTSQNDNNEDTNWECSDGDASGGDDDWVGGGAECEAEHCGDLGG